MCEVSVIELECHEMAQIQNERNASLKMCVRMTSFKKWDMRLVSEMRPGEDYLLEV